MSPVAEPMEGRRFVAFADILGFRSLIATSNLSDVAHNIQLLLSSLSDLRFLFSRGPREGETPLARFTPRHLHFSDTVVLWSNVVQEFGNFDRFRTGAMFAKLLTGLLSRAFISGIPLRVGMAFGQTYIDLSRRIILGQPIVDAYTVQEAQDWVGGAIHDSVPAYTVQGNGTAVPHRIPLKYRVPLVGCAALDWLYQVAVEPPRSAKGRGNYERALAAYISNARDPKVKRKYRNVHKFYTSRRKQLANYRDQGWE